MEAAIRAVTNGEMGVNAASRSFNVPTTTLRDRLSGRVAKACMVQQWVQNLT